ncbi:MAG: putative RNA helicase [Sarea resinae]|nr:MAG: putative RNA helicase [Sarea resinae]
MVSRRSASVSEDSSSEAPSPEHLEETSSADSSDQSDQEHIDTSTNGSRKRRRLSPASSEELDAEPATAAPLPAATLSRVKAKKPGLLQSNTIPPSNADTAINGTAKASFASLGVHPWLVASLSAMAIKRPTGIQSGCIPEILKGRDCIGGSRTGSGKTVAFAVPILQKWAEDPIGIFAVVLTPTRELALQIFEQFKALSSSQSLKPILVTGGADMRTQALALSSRPHIVIATPGRLADHITNSGEDTICALRRVRIVVLDEADRLLQPSAHGSMLPDVETCLSILPPPEKRQTLLFTATVTPEVRALKDSPRHKKHPPHICEVDTEALAIPPTLKQTYLQVPLTHREAYLHTLLQTPANAAKRAILIFTNRTSTATLLTHLLHLLEHRVTSLHSQLPQAQRTANLGRFRAAAARVLVATDVAARGLDIPAVDLVVNYDVPRDPVDYIHRVGRTARAGRAGEAITLVGQRDVQLVLAIEARVGRPMVEWAEDGVSVETRVLRDGLRLVGEKKREAVLEIEEGREVGGKRKVVRGAKRLREM